ncbi:MULTISPECIES: helix-turn-helix domain-containing protein [Enterococcus]|uniref:helix-turn-helix domain-containing protein n=1 Tax=Enterococcus TaxID=1350 RepID=UPI0015588FB6|nr:helix-turn-helix transcriptional regulator [Enterococcus gallinarum]MDO6296694.1 helix-turn-helix transcriptional regulator [Enterococcus gallinarum]MDT2714306.1 helix-turn-helix transcriptional regulator [Enterococcus gallinarum]NQE03139.1 helix-turn-helix transcriptional regulator [Enterococcus gallinarum]
MLLERVDRLIAEKKMSRAELERRLDLSQGSIRNWNKKNPGIDKIQKVADFFDVSTDYLLGRTEKRRYYDLTEKDERDIQKELELIIEDMKNSDAIAFSKDTEELSPEARAAILSSIEESLRIGKALAKKKYTPKKYRDK